MPRPIACLFVRFLAAADYLPVSSDFVVALGGLTKAGLVFVVRVELDGDGGLVLIGGGLLACLAVLEKHGFVLSSGGASFPCLRCLYILYVRRVLALASFLFLWGLKHNSALRRCLLEVPAGIVGRPVGRRLFLPRRRGRYRSSSGHHGSLLACPLRFVSVCVGGGGGVLASPPPACAVLLAVSPGGSGVCVLVPRGVHHACLPCDTVSPSSPFYPTSWAGRGVSAFRRRGRGVPIGFSSAWVSGSALLAFLSMSAGRLPAIWS